MVPSNVSDKLGDNFQQILDNYLAVKKSKFGTNNIINSSFQNLEKSIVTLINSVGHNSLIVNSSSGKGNWANVPWLSIIDQARPATMQDGEYIVYLFKSDMSGFYLTLNQGVTEPLKHGKKKGTNILEGTASKLRNSLSNEDKQRLTENSFNLDNEIFLAKTGLGAKYEPGTIIHKFYNSGSLPTEEEIIEDLRLLIDIYLKLPKDINKSDENMIKVGEQVGLYDGIERENTSNYWIFQSNPKYYDILGALKEYQSMGFTVSRYKDEIKPKDTVFIWASGKDAGIYAIAEVTSLPYKLGYTPPPDHFDREERNVNEKTINVDIDVLEVLTRPLLKKQLISNSELIDLPIITSPQGTNFRVSKSQGDLLMELIKENRIIIDETDDEPLVMEPFDIAPFINALKEANLQFDDLFVIRFVASLLAKKFIILTGLSGSGKTKLATTFANWISDNPDQICLVPVGADWTNREPLLGFSNALVKGSYVKPDTGVIDLMIRAEKDTSRPYFLILDEMNLSHVERYFADFLSAMESEEKILLHPDDQKDWNGSDVPSTISVPNNLFIIGTVNVDETTYMFSPKVLDRAFVHEFRVSSKDMRDFLGNPIKTDASGINFNGAGMARDFLEKAAATYGDFDNSEVLKDNISLFFNELKTLGSEFGYRTASEIYRYGAILSTFDDNGSIGIDNIIDAAVVSKLLPKIHGSRRKLEQTLISLFKLCISSPDGEDISDYVSRKKEIVGNENIALPVSSDKIVRMYRQVIQDGFTSFSEA